MGESETWYNSLSKKELMEIIIEITKKSKNNVSHDENEMDLLRSMKIYRQNNRVE